MRRCRKPSNAQHIRLRWLGASPSGSQHEESTLMPSHSFFNILRLSYPQPGISKIQYLYISLHISRCTYLLDILTPCNIHPHTKKIYIYIYIYIYSCLLFRSGVQVWGCTTRMCCKMTLAAYQEMLKSTVPKFSNSHSASNNARTM